MHDAVYTAAAVGLIALMTALSRALPYLLFGGKRELPPLMINLGGALPPAIMAILVFYCLRGVEPAVFPYGLPEAASVALVVVAQVLKKNTFLSIFLGTVCYMLLIRLF